MPLNAIKKCHASRLPRVNTISIASTTSRDIPDPRSPVDASRIYRAGSRRRPSCSATSTSASPISHGCIAPIFWCPFPACSVKYQTPGSLDPQGQNLLLPKTEGLHGIVSPDRCFPLDVQHLRGDAKDSYGRPWLWPLCCQIKLGQHLTSLSGVCSHHFPVSKDLRVLYTVL